MPVWDRITPGDPGDSLIHTDISAPARHCIPTISGAVSTKNRVSGVDYPGAVLRNTDLHGATATRGVGPIMSALRPRKNGMIQATASNVVGTRDPGIVTARAAYANVG